MDKKEMSCIDCGVKNCDKGDKTFPEFCLTTHMDPEILREAMELYQEEENHRVTVAAAEVEYEHYCNIPGWRRSWPSPRRSAPKDRNRHLRRTSEGKPHLAAILRKHGFEVYGVACKAGTVPKTEVGIPEECCSLEKNMCNPILQAKILNAKGTQLNVVMGLCVGHDSLFYKYSRR